MSKAQKNHVSGLLFTFLCGTLGFCFFALNFVNRKTIECFSLKLNKYLKDFCCYPLVVPCSTTPKQLSMVAKFRLTHFLVNNPYLNVCFSGFKFVTYTFALSILDT